MDPLAYSVLRIVHLASMAVWFAASLTAPGDIRRAAQKPGPIGSATADKVQRALSISVGAALMTVVSGLGMLFAHGGFAGVKPTIHAGLALTLVALAIEFFWQGPAFRKAKEALEHEGEDATKPAKGFAAATGVMHLLRFTILVLMVLRT